MHKVYLTDRSVFVDVCQVSNTKIPLGVGVCVGRDNLVDVFVWGDNVVGGTVVVDVRDG